MDWLLKPLKQFIKVECQLLFLWALASVATFYLIWVQQPYSLEEFRNLAIILLGPIGLGLAVWRSIIAHRGSQLAERGHATDRFSKAVEQISSDKLYERLGGLHALAQIARTAQQGFEKNGTARHHVEDLEAVRGILCEFIRTPPYEKQRAKRWADINQWSEDYNAYPARSSENPKLKKPVYPHPINCPDVHLALEALTAAAHPTNQKHNIRRANLSHLNLDNAVLSDIDISMSNLDWSSFRSAVVNNLDAQNSSFFAAKLSAVKITNSNFIDTELQGVDFDDAEFHQSMLKGANLSSASCHQLHLFHTNIDDVGFEGSTGFMLLNTDENTWCWDDSLPKGLDDKNLAAIRKAYNDDDHRILYPIGAAPHPDFNNPRYWVT